MTNNDFVLPEKWYIRWTSKEVFQACCEYFKRTYLYVQGSAIDAEVTYYPSGCTLNGTEITFEQFKRYVMNETQEAFVLPQKWCVAVTGENRSLLEDWRRYGRDSLYSVVGGFHGYLHSDKIWSISPGSTPVITLEQFKEYVLKPKQFVLPEKWCVRMNDPLVVEYCNRYGENPEYSLHWSMPFAHFPAFKGYAIMRTTSMEPKSGYTEITLDQFKKYVVKPEKSSQSQQNTQTVNTTNDTPAPEAGVQIISREGLKAIHAVACSGWQAKLKRYADNAPAFDTHIKLTSEQVAEMFKAAQSHQLPVLLKYFKQPVEDKNAFKKPSSTEALNRKLSVLSSELFDNSSTIQLLIGCAPTKELIDRAFFVPSNYRVEVGEASGTSGTYIAIFKK